MDKLSEEDFIQENKGGSSGVVWMTMILLIGVFLLIFTSVDWSVKQTQMQIEKSPFLRVTNREFSLFLWQHTDFMRPHIKKRTGYLPDYHLLPKVTPMPEKAENWVVAPPEILFRYHVWDRLLSTYTYSREISVEDFQRFLNYAEEWQPQYWSEAPAEYIQGTQVTQLPKAVQQAFVGWKNYFDDGDAINSVSYTVGQIYAFIEHYPNFQRTYWQNLIPDYLLTAFGEDDKSVIVPKEEIPSFLRVALYNHYHAR